MYLQSIGIVAVCALVKALLIRWKQMSRKQVIRQKQPNLQRLTSPTAGKLEPCLSSAVRALRSKFQSSVLSFPSPVLCTESFAFDYSQGLVLRVLKVGDSAIEPRYSATLEWCFQAYAYISITGSGVQGFRVSLIG